MSAATKILGEAVLKQGLRYLGKDPEKNLPKILNWAQKIAIRKQDKETIESLKKHVLDPDNNWHKFAVTLLTRTDPHVAEKIGVNFFLNASLLGTPKQLELSEKYDINVPWAILIDPTAACNLRCVGCWAGEYKKSASLDYETLDRVIGEAEDLGIYFTIFSGGEPTVRKKDLIRLAEAHPDSVFLSFTNATLIDEPFIEEVKRVGNLAFAISIEGFEQTTDERRGKGVYKKVISAMEKLRNAGCIFGFSTTYKRGNIDEVSSDEFIDLMVEKGCVFGWYFTYVPVGRDADLDLMATPEERATMYKRINEIRATKPIFVLDFWNDGEAAMGCIAGGRRYLHINAHGDVEPCAFIHYATCNIKDTTLFEALKSPLMQAYRKRQPFNENMLRPCPMLDNPEQLREMVHEANAYSTQYDDPEPVDELADKLKPYSEKWGAEADEIWQKHLEEKQKTEVAAANQK
jgi:MoaA/NifB/PqqE/SkfB family radical SAM enzyme